MLNTCGGEVIQRGQQVHERNPQWTHPRTPNMKRMMWNYRLWNRNNLVRMLCHHIWFKKIQSSFTFTIQLKILSISRSFLEFSNKKSMFTIRGTFNMRSYYKIIEFKSSKLSCIFYSQWSTFCSHEPHQLLHLCAFSP